MYCTQGGGWGKVGLFQNLRKVDNKDALKSYETQKCDGNPHTVFATSMNIPSIFFLKLDFIHTTIF
jgi:hypothetical protein